MLARLLMVIVMSVSAPQAFAQDRDASYDALVSLFTEWRAFERPPFRDGAPDYTAATFERRHAELPAWRAKLAAIKPDAWPIPQQVDWHVLRAEMNGFDFHVRDLRPWVRDPSY